MMSCANRIPGSFFSFIGVREEPGYTIQVVRHVRKFHMNYSYQVSTNYCSTEGTRTTG